MLGLVVIAFIAAYLAVSVLVVWLAARWAKRHNRRAWIWGGLAAFAMYNLVFWDWIPTVAMHKYYCATEAGFWVYKTPEQWVKENPGVLETLRKDQLPLEQYYKPKQYIKRRGKVELIRDDLVGYVIGEDKLYVMPDGTRVIANFHDGKLGTVEFKKQDGSWGYQLNSRFRLSFKNEELFLSISRQVKEVVDAETGFILARHLGFTWGSGWSFVGSSNKWEGAFGTLFLGSHTCRGDKINSDKLINFSDNFRGEEINND